MAQISYIQKQDIENAERFDAEYFKPEYLEIEKRLEEINFSTVKEVSNDSIEYGTTPEGGIFEAKGVPYIKSEFLKDKIIFDKNNLVFCKKDFHIKNIKSEVLPNDILFSAVGATIGEVAILSKKIEQANTNQNIAKLRIRNNEFLPKFVFIYFLSKYGNKQLQRYKTGNAQPYLNSLQIKSLRIPVLPKPFQLKIEKIVKQAHTKQQQAKELYAKAEQILLTELDLIDFKPKHQLSFSTTKSRIENAERFDSEYFHPKVLMLRDRFESKNSIKIKDSIIMPLVSGSTPKSGGTDYLKNGDIKFIRAVNLNNLAINYDNVLYIKDQVHNKLLKRSQIQEGDVLFSIAGVIGRCAVVTRDIGQANINQALSIIRLNQKLFNPYYVALLFNSKYGNKYVNDIARPVAQTNINLTELSNICIPQLDLGIQTQIAEKITLSHKLRQESKELLELAKLKVEQEIEKTNI